MKISVWIASFIIAFLIIFFLYSRGVYNLKNTAISFAITLIVFAFVLFTTNNIINKDK